MSDSGKLDDEKALFRAEMADAKPLRHNRRAPVKKAEPPVIRPASPIEGAFASERFSAMLEPELVGNEEMLGFRRAGIQHRQFAKLKSGRIHLEAELDLHGMTLLKAEPALAQFLDQCQQQRIRYIRIIHGKGWGSRDNKPVLKSKVNQWLRDSQMVLAFCSATITDGGAGAVYVMLRRPRD